MFSEVHRQIFRCLLLAVVELFPLLFSAPETARVFLLMPFSRDLNGDAKFWLGGTTYKLRQTLQRKYPGMFVLQHGYKIIDKDNPADVIKMFCDEIFKQNVNTIIYLKLNTRRMATSDYIVNTAEFFGYPLISWDPEFPGALQDEKDSRLLQMAPTIYHQCVLMIDIMKKYNWTDFTIVTTTSSHHLEFINSISSIIGAHNTKVKFDRKLKFTLLNSIVITDTAIAKTTILKENKKTNRVFLLHSSSREAKDILQTAESLGLTGEKYMWILSSFCIGAIQQRASNSYPIGVLGITYSSIDGDKFDQKIIEAALKTSVGIWANALEKIYISRNQYSIVPNFTCQSNQPLTQWKDGATLYRYMKNSRRVGIENTAVDFSSNGVNQLLKLRIVNCQKQTKKYETYQVWKEVGKWIQQVDNRTGRTHMKIEMTDITWPGNAGKPPRGKPEKRFFRIVTFQEEPYVIYVEKDKKTGKCVHPAVPCRLVYDEKNHKNDSSLFNNTVSRCCAGLCIDLLKVLSTEMEFDYELYEVPDLTWGLPDQETGEWNGLIRQITDRKADMVLTSLKITPKRNGVIDFSVPFLETGITIAVSIRKGHIAPTAFLDSCADFYWFVFLFLSIHMVAICVMVFETLSNKFKSAEPYDYPLWCLILVVSVHTTGLFIFVYEWLSPHGLNRGKTSLRDHKFSLFRSFWLIWAMLFGSSLSTDNPRGASSRFLANVWALFALVFLASYTANLAAFMITKDLYYNLSGIKDWRLKNPYLHKPPFKFATIPNGSTEENLRQNHYNMYKYMQKYNKATVEEAIAALKDGKIQAFIYDATPLEYRAGNDPKCDLKTVGEKYAMTGYGIGVPKGQKYLAEINEVILELQESGELERLRKFWLSGACHTNKKQGTSQSKIGILHFTSAFILLATGMLLGGFLLVFEHLYFKFGRNCLRKYDKNGLCSLISLSMGKSLTFEQSVIKAIEVHKKYRCKDPLCETHLWKVRHQLDLSLLHINRLKEQLVSYGIKPVDCHFTPIETKEKLKPNGCPPKPMEFSVSEEIGTNEKCGSSLPESPNSISANWKPKSLKRSSSYTNAVDLDINQPEKQKVRFNDGKFYIGVDNDISDQDLL